jgi:hypothetical protein
MQDDKRNLSVARGHLKSAYEEVMRAQGWTERDISGAALDRALDQLNLVVRRLEQQRVRLGRGEVARAVEGAFAGVTLALQGVHDVRNNSSMEHGPLLEQVRTRLAAAIEAVDEACRLADVRAPEQG